MGTAPVCHLSVDEVITQPNRTGLPNTVAATDLESALQAIYNLNQIINQLLGRLPDRGGSGNNKQEKKQKIGRYQEQRQLRVTEKKKIFNPEDKDQFVEVERINRLVFKDTVTGELWEWDR